MVRFIHAADIHLDSPMRHLERYEGAPAEEIRGSTRRAFENLIELALQQSVDFLIIAGDLYDGDWKDHNTGLFFASQVARLKSAGIPLYFISGNHDAANKLTKALPLPSNPDGSPMMLSSTEVQTIELPDLGVALHGRGFRAQAETDNLSEGYPKALSGMHNIGILHTSLQGSSGHTPYAPCTPQQLADKGYNYWALGHIHLRGNRAIEGSCPIVFSGNTQGRSVRECGAKGCYLVEIDSSGNAKLDFHAVDVCRWEVCEIDAAKINSVDDLAVEFVKQVNHYVHSHEGYPIVVRAHLTGESSNFQTMIAEQEQWQSTLRSATFEIEAPVWMERLRIDVSPQTDSQIDDISGPMGELSQLIAGISKDESALNAIMQSLDPLVKKLPSELMDQNEGLCWGDPDGLSELISGAQSLLSQRLAKSEVPS